ncbi:MAG: DUF4254 domain-containing protein [Arenicella sp.]
MMNSTTANLAQTIIELQHQFTIEWHDNDDAPRPINEFEALVVDQHKRNFDLWHQEDKAREPDVSDANIAQVKRNIDQLNQKRNDMVTELDIMLEQHYFPTAETDDLPWNSETAGSIIDRLSIASLKVFHMQEQTERSDASAEHIEKCKQKTYELEVQRHDLTHSLQLFFDDIVAGKKQNKLYKQFKMYNDPELNPKIYAKK